MDKVPDNLPPLAVLGAAAAVGALVWFAGLIPGVLALVFAAGVAASLVRRSALLSRLSRSAAGAKGAAAQQKKASSSPEAGLRVVITGASSGLGAVVAEEFARRGASVLLAARRTDALAEVAERCRGAAPAASAASAPTVAVVACDVGAGKAAGEALVAEAERVLGGVDVLLLNAGVGQFYLLEQAPGTDGAGKDDNAGGESGVSEAAWKQVFDVNYWGTVWPAFAALPALRRSNGRLVVMSSVGGVLPMARQTLYNASKHALHGFFDSLRIELDGAVSVTLLQPGYIKTEMTSGKNTIGRAGEVGMGATLAAKKKAESASASAAASAAAPKTNPVWDMMRRHAMPDAEDVAPTLVDAIMARQRNLITPYWYSIPCWIRALSPELFDWAMGNVTMASRRRALSTKKTN